MLFYNRYQHLHFFILGNRLSVCKPDIHILKRWLIKSEMLNETYCKFDKDWYHLCKSHILIFHYLIFIISKYFCFFYFLKIWILSIFFFPSILIIKLNIMLSISKNILTFDINYRKLSNKRKLIEHTHIMTNQVNVKNIFFFFY